MSNTEDQAKVPDIYHARGPYIMWVNNGYEGWSPRSYGTLKEAILGERYNNDFVITKIVDFETKEKGGR